MRHDSTLLESARQGDLVAVEQLLTQQGRLPGLAGYLDL